MQQIQIIGRIGNDAVIRESASNRFTSFSVAVDDNYKDRDGQKVERTQWYDITTDQTNITKYLTKGTQVYLQGRLRVDTFTDRDNKVKPQCKISAYKIELLSSPPATERTPAAQQTAAVPVASGDDQNNDLPF